MTLDFSMPTYIWSYFAIPADLALAAFGAVALHLDLEPAAAEAGDVRRARECVERVGRACAAAILQMVNSERRR